MHRDNFFLGEWSSSRHGRFTQEEMGPPKPFE
jgi:hypothetical protein